MSINFLTFSINTSPILYGLVVFEIWSKIIINLSE